MSTTINITLGGGGTHTIVVDDECKRRTAVETPAVREKYANDVKPCPAWMDSPADVPVSDNVVDYEFVPSHTGQSHLNGEPKGYVVTTLNGWAIACTCPDFNYRQRACKHMTDDVGSIFHKGDLIA